MSSICRIRSQSTLALALIGLASCPAAAHPGSGIAVNKTGHVYFVDTGSGVWKIDAAGRISKIPGPGYHWMALDEKNDFARSRLPKDRDTDMVAAGSDPTILLSSDYPILIGRDGNLYYAQKPAGRALQMMKMTPAGATSALGDIPAGTKGPLNWIHGLAAGPDGAIYYTDDNAVFRMTSRGQATNVATVTAPVGATLTPGHTADMGPKLRGLAVDEKGMIYVASSADGRLLKVTPDGKVSLALQVESPWSPTAVAVHDGSIYVQEYLHTPGDDRRQWLPRVRKITADGKSAIIATTEQMPGAR